MPVTKPDVEWFELIVRPAPSTIRIRWMGKTEIDFDGMAKRRRGHGADLHGLRFEWTGTSNPPDFMATGPHVALMSQRAHDRFSHAGIKGLGYLPVTVALPDGSVIDYSLLIVPNEVDSICFRSSDRHDGRMFVLRDPVIQGLNVHQSDVFILPYDLGMQNIIVSSRFLEVAEYARVTNATFRPVKQLAVLLPDPESVLC